MRGTEDALRHQISVLLASMNNPRPDDRDRPADARLWHPWLRVQRALPVFLGTRWDRETWRLVRPEIRNALAERSRIERAGWFN
jgi:hypothetical protein